jgi:hypothetical protein
VLAEVSNPIIARTQYSFEGEINVQNETRMFFECWDATMAVGYFYSLLKKAGQVSIDCGSTIATVFLFSWVVFNDRSTIPMPGGTTLATLEHEGKRGRVLPRSPSSNITASDGCIPKPEQSTHLHKNFGLHTLLL